MIEQNPRKGHEGPATPVVGFLCIWGEFLGEFMKDFGKEWIGFDLDRTLAYYDHWQGLEHIGEPIPQMLQLLKYHLSLGHRVKIFTARVCNMDGKAEYALKFIEEWCMKHIGQVLEVTCTKDYSMILLYDDRCKQVLPNQGIIVS